MDAFYLLIFITGVLLIISNLRKIVNLKKEKLEIIQVLDQDNKVIRTIGLIFFIIMAISISFLIYGMIQTKVILQNEIYQIVIMGVIFIGVYLPLVAKTKLTNKGVIKNLLLIKWDDIKAVEYLKPIKNKSKIRISYLAKINRPIRVDIVFITDSEEYNKFKEVVKESRKKGKKGKKKN